MNFRNYENAELEFSPLTNIIYGNNAQGKTNLLEAIGYLGSGKGFRSQKASELVRRPVEDLRCLLRRFLLDLRPVVVAEVLARE